MTVVLVILEAANGEQPCGVAEGGKCELSIDSNQVNGDEDGYLLPFLFLFFVHVMNYKDGAN